MLTVFLPEDKAAAVEALAAWPAKAGKQRDVLAFMLEQGGPLALQALLAEAGGSPASVRAVADKGLLELREIEQQRDPYASREFERTNPLPLTEGQQSSIRRA